MALQYNKECYICGSEQNLHRHHIFHGTSNRANSEKYNMVVWLCFKHHNGSKSGVHFNRQADMRLMMDAQRDFEANIGTREDFRAVFGKSYL